jgi:tRNA U34 5-methylaminomethyl-2-thiouridine-forming methyltransferase MnmC
LKRQIITTSDGSKTIQISDWNEHYHSIHGAIQEANHVFIKHGLLFCLNDLEKDFHNSELALLEIGFGTGLNAFLTFIESERLGVTIKYTGVEAYPVLKEELDQLNYVEIVNAQYKDQFDRMHSSPWAQEVVLSTQFSLFKQQEFFENIHYKSAFDLIYFDAFGARVQPDLWTESIFEKMFQALRDRGVLVTYAAKGSVRRAMKAVGFKVERLPGPPGKREMLRARKVL